MCDADPVDEAIGLLLAPGEQQDQPAEDREQEHAENGGEAVVRVVAVQRDRDEEGQPEDDVEDDGRADALGGQAEGGRVARHVGIGEQAVADRRPGHGAAREDMAHGQGPHVDPEEPETAGARRGTDRVGELGVGGQGGHLDGGPEDQPEEVEVVELTELLAGAVQFGREDDLDHEEEEQHRQRDLHVAGEPALFRGAASPGRRRPSHSCFHVFIWAKLLMLVRMADEQPETWRSRWVRMPGRRGVPLATIVVAMAVAIGLIDLNAALILGLWVLRKIVLYIVIAFFLSLLFTPAMRLLKRRGISHGVAATIVFLGGLIVIAGLVYLFASPLVTSAVHFGQEIPNLVKSARKGGPARAAGLPPPPAKIPVRGVVAAHQAADQGAQAGHRASRSGRRRCPR